MSYQINQTVETTDWIQEPQTTLSPRPETALQNPDNSTMPPARPRIIGLDGLRAIAMLFVVFYHVFPKTFSVGFVGVDIFFVISGFLITSLLLREKQVNGKVKITGFWIRRIRRIMPAVILTTIVTAALATFVALIGPLSSSDATTGLRWQIIGAFTGLYNWFEIANSSSYFDATNPILLTNLWSLAVELQFYICWPLLLWIITRLSKNTKIRVTITLALAGTSALWHQFLMLTNDANPTRAYVATDSHVFGLMIGAAVALALPDIMVRPRKTAAPYWGWVSLAALAVLISFALLGNTGAWFYPWGMFLASVLAAFTIRGILPDNPTGPGAILGQVLESKPFSWLGIRSYGIYLWHWPLWVIGYYIIELDREILAVIVIVLSVLCAHLSYEYVENPIRSKTFNVWMKEILQKPRKAGVMIFVVILLILPLTAYGAVTSSNLTSAQQIVADGEAKLKTGPKNSQSETEKAKNTGSQEQTKRSQNAGPETKSTPKAPAQPKVPEKPKDPPIGQLGVQPRVNGADVVFIGDSVTLASTEQILAQLPGALIDATVSRAAITAPGILQQMQNNGTIRPYIVISLATNGVVQPETIDELLKIAGPDRKFVFVTGFAPDYATWVPEANATIHEYAKKYPQQIAVADWAAIAPNHLAELAGDQIHPGSAAAQYYANEVARALNTFVP